MTVSSLLFKETLLEVTKLKNNIKELKGFVRLVNKNKKNLKTLGFFMDKDTFLELLELIEYGNPKFWEELELSRKSGVVSSRRIEEELNLK